MGVSQLYYTWADKGLQGRARFQFVAATRSLAGGPVPPTHRTTRTDYVYAMEMRGGKVAHMTKIWNSGYALKELGWA